MKREPEVSKEVRHPHGEFPLPFLKKVDLCSSHTIIHYLALVLLKKRK